MGFILLVAAAAVAALVYVAGWALKQGSSTSPTVIEKKVSKGKK